MDKLPAEIFPQFLIYIDDDIPKFARLSKYYNAIFKNIYNVLMKQLLKKYRKFDNVNKIQYKTYLQLKYRYEKILLSRTPKYEHILVQCAKNGDLEIAELLLSSKQIHRFEFDGVIPDAIHEAAKNKHNNVIELILEFAKNKALYNARLYDKPSNPKLVNFII